MKQRLLLAVWLLAATFYASWAQTWTAPVDPSSSGVDVVDGGTYYIRNVGCGQYIIGANSWATQISVSSDYTPYFNVVAEKMTAENDGVQVTGFRLKMNGTFYFSGDHDRVNFAVSNTYLFRDSEASGFVDLRAQSRNAIWVLTKDDKGYYRIQSTTENGMFPNAATQYAYAQAPGQAVVFDKTEASVGSGNIAYLEWEFIPTTVSVDDIALYSARKSLYDALLAAYNAGVEDYKAASDVYENSSSVSEIGEATKLLKARTNLYEWIQKAKTYEIDASEATSVYQSSTNVATINAAADALKESVNYAMLLAEIPNSTLEKPLDITDFVLKNANFDEGNTNGWEVTQTMGQNLGYQSASYVNGEVTISKFIEAWIPTPGTLKDGVIAQTISGLPEGHYRLECDGIAVRQNDESLEVTGVYLFYDNGSIIYKSPSSLNTGNGAPEHLTFEFDYDGASDMKIGLMTSSTNANWLAADNFKLYAIGPMLVPPSYTALQNALPAYESMSLDGMAYTGDINRFSTAIKNARNLVDAGSDPTLKDTYTQAAQELEAAAAAYRSSIAAYVTFRQFIDEKKNHSYGSDAINNAVSTQLATYESAYSARSYSTEQIQQCINGFEGTILHAAMEARESDLVQTDLTPYLSDMAFANTTEQIHYPNTPAVWQNETGTTSFLTAYETAEVWNQSAFNIYREIGNMPAGEYILTVQALYRESESVTNYENYINETLSGIAQFYAGEQTKSLPNISVVAQPESSWTPLGYADSEGYELYVPNTQNQANAVFNGGYGDEYSAKTLVSLDVVVGEGETLRFGIRASNLLENAWVVWKDFRLYAKGTDTPALITLTNVIKQAEQKGYSEETKADGAVVGAYLTTLADAKTMAAERKSTNSEYAAKATELTNAISAVETSMAQYVELTDLIAEAQQILESLQGSKFTAATSAVTTVANEMQNAYDQGTATAEMIAGWDGAAMKKLRENLQWSDVTKGTDLTFLIRNANFNRGQYGPNEGSVYTGTDKSIPGWKMASGTLKELSGEYHNIEAYHQAFDFQQTIPDVPAGIYEISVQGFVRVDDGENDMSLYAGISSRTFKKQTDEYSTTCLLSDGSVDTDGNPSSTPNNWPYDYPHTDLTGDGTTVYVPHSMQGANIYFNTLNPATGLPFYTNIVNITHTGGDLTIGVRCSNVNLWIIWDNFRIAYKGGLAQDEVIEELMTALKSSNVAIQSVKQEIEDACKAGEQVLGTDYETQAPVIEQLRLAQTHAAEANTQIESFMSAYQTYAAWPEAARWEKWETYTSLARTHAFASLDDLSATVFQLDSLGIDQVSKNLKAAQELATSTMYLGTKQALATAIESVASVLETPERSTINQAHAQLAEAVAAAEASIADYERLAGYIEETQSIAEIYGPMLEEEVKETIANKLSLMQQAYSAGAVTADEITAIWTDLQTTTRTIITNHIQPLVTRAGELLEKNLSDQLYSDLTEGVSQAQGILEMTEFTASNAPTVKAKYEALLQSVNAAEAYLLMLASLTDELTVGKDLTPLIVNPNFTYGEKGWTAENMFQEGGATEGCVINDDYTNGDVTISKFAESWRSNRAVDDASISQVISNLPAGAYALEADIITAAYDESLSLYGVHLFAASTERITTMLCRTEYDQPLHRRMLINHDGGDLTIGVRISETNANWVAMDNFRLFVADAPNAADIAILQQAHEQMGGSSSWLEPWDLDTNPFSPAGVTFKEGRVVEVDLSGYGISSPFPTALLSLPNLEQLNLSDNTLSGSISDALATMIEERKTSGVRSIDISRNSLTGNIGVMGVACPQLETLLANNNSLEGCTPDLPATIQSLNLQSQTLSSIWDYKLSDQESSLQTMPSILAYSHDGDADYSILTSSLEDWKMSLQVNADGITFKPSTEKPYKRQNNEEMVLTATSGAAKGSTLTMHFIFQPGDADFNGLVNVSDLQSSILYMFNDWNSKAYNYTAANLFTDEIINVQDIVKLVNVLLDDETPAETKRLMRARANINIINEESAEAHLFWRGNELVLQTTVPVSAADISLNTAGDVEWQVEKLGFTVSQRKRAGSHRAILYSLSDVELPVGETVLAKVNSTATISDVLMTERSSAPLNVSVEAQLATGINELAIADGSWTLVASNGVIVARGTGRQEWQSTRGTLAAGIYILSNTLHQTHKVIIK